MVLVRERMLDIVDVIRNEIHAGMQQVAAFVEAIEKTDRLAADCTVPLEFRTLRGKVDSTISNLKKYDLLFPSVLEVVEQTEHLVDSFSERFMDWAEGKPKFMTVTEAMEHFQRSRSTIYRWIKSGRIDAMKQGRFWRIAV